MRQGRSLSTTDQDGTPPVAAIRNMALPPMTSARGEFSRSDDIQVPARWVEMSSLNRSSGKLFHGNVFPRRVCGVGGPACDYPTRRGLGQPVTAARDRLQAPAPRPSRRSTATRLRKGSTNSVRGAAKLLADALATARRAGAVGLVLVRADSAYYGYDIVAAARRAGARFSVTAD
jgi:hypothetical protein